MKIAFVVGVFPVMSEKFIISQITGLIDRGHTVKIFPCRVLFEEQIHSEIDKYALMDCVYQLQSVPRLRLLRVLKGLFLVMLHYPRHPVLMTKLLKLFFGKYSKMSLLGFFRWTYPFIKENFDIIHSHFGPNGNRCVSLMNLGLSSKFITTFHGYDVTTYINEHGKNVYDDLFKHCDCFTYNSESTKKKVLQLGCLPEKMAKLPMGIHLDEIQFKERVIEKDGKINVLSVGRLVEMKGREYAIKAMARIINKYPNVRYTIVGDGPLRNKLKSMIHEEMLSDKIRIEGWVSTERLATLYDEAHIFLHPSIVATDGNTEGQGVVLAEAQAYGIPVLATRHGAFPESVLEGESGFLVPEKDVDSLFERLEYLVLNPNKWPVMGRKGRLFVEKKFDNDLLCDRIVEIYQHAL